MDSSLPSQPLVSPVSILLFAAGSQLGLALWVMDVTITTASSILLGFVLFGVLARAVRDVLASIAQENRAFGAARASR